MEAKSIGALIAILIVVIFAGYIIAGGVTGLFINPPGSSGAAAQTLGEDAGGTPIEVNKNLPEEPPAGTEGPPAETEEPAEPADICQAVTCNDSTVTCPDSEVVSCQNTCDPATGQCPSCSPDCSGHQAATGGGGGGGPPSPSTCTDTSWTPQGEWSDCSAEGKQTRTLRSNCGSTKTETRDCEYNPPEEPSTTYLLVSPVTQQANAGDNIAVDVKINTTEEIYAAEFKLHFDKDIVNATGVLEGDFFRQDGAQAFPIMTIKESEGSIIFANTRYGTPGGVSGEGTLATITFTALASGTSQLNIVDVMISDPGLLAVENVSVSDGAVEVA